MGVPCGVKSRRVETVLRLGTGEKRAKRAGGQGIGEGEVVGSVFRSDFFWILSYFCQF